ncbi:unnamed protein product, partial [Rotaria sp. Silwood1]
MSKAYSGYKINNQTILEEHIDENYEPTDEEIHEYAIYIGIEPEKEKDLLWLAREGLMKPLPSGWKACQEENGELYYFNFNTGKSSWDHPYDEIYKTRVIQARDKKTSSSIVFDTLSKGKNTSSISDLSSGKNPHNLPLQTKNDTIDNQFDSQYINSDSSGELNNSENDHTHSSNDFQKDVYFGIDRELSARIEREENEPTAIITPSPQLLFTDNREQQLENSQDNHERIKLTSLAAEYPLNTNKTSTNGNTSVTQQEDIDLANLRKRLEQSANDEKLQLLEDNRIYIEKLKIELRLAKEQEEQILRDKMKADLILIENNIHENFLHEKKLFQNRQQNELNNIKEIFEKEKQELQKKLRSDMLSDLNLEQQNNTNIQIRLLQMKHEFDEKLRNVENRYKNEIEDLTQRYEQIKIENDTLEKRLKEKTDFCSTLQRTMTQLRGDNSSLEQKLQDAQSELKAIDDSNKQIQLSSNHIDDDNSNFEQTQSNNKYTFHDDDDEGLSDTDSDVIQMKQTLNEFKHISSFSKPINNIDEKQHSKPKTVNLTDLSNNDIGSVIQNISFERRSNQSLIDSGQWTNTML